MKKLVVLLTLFSCLVLILNHSDAQKKSLLNKYTFGEFKARHIGPAVMSGRISAIDGVAKDPSTIYVGTAGGGIWKSENMGTTFKPVFDKQNQSIGTITIDQARPDTVWVGTGEVWVRNSVSVGDGIYLSTDGGENWKHKGLDNSERISKILINHENPNIIYAGVLGNLWNDSENRGVYKTTDAGKTWEKILYIDDETGCSDMTMDPANPDHIFAGMWNFRRKPFFFRSGGLSSGLYETFDGGETWKKVKLDLPGDTIGRIAVAYSPADSNTLWVLVESKKSGLYRSTDNGKNWKLMNDDPLIGMRPFYFAYIVPDPIEKDRIYKPGFTLSVSDDGGEHFTSPFIEGGNVHSDIHAMWINPHDNKLIYMGTDGGIYISHDKGNSWKFARKLPVSTFYHVAVDNQDPYYVYGGLQDNGSWFAPSTNPGGIGNKNWEFVGYGDGFNVFPDKEDNTIIYWQSQGGNINKRFIDSWEVKNIKPFSEAGKEELRFNWNTPMIQSESTNALYVGAQYLFKSHDQGNTWQRISPDLTTNDKKKQKQEETGGLTLDNSTAENHCTLFTIAESPLDTNIIWVGTDDGNLQVTKKAGKKWKNVVKNISGLPENTWCSSVCPGLFDANTAYVTFDGHREGDMTPYVFKTTDLGKTWTNITDENIKGYCHKILQDHVNPDLLFLGTEYGLFISIDDGKTWTQFTGDVPNVSIRDMAIQKRENDLVLATHGRGILIIDDITPLQELEPEHLDQELVFLNSKPYEIDYPGYKINHKGDDEFLASNPPNALQISYYMKKRHIFGDMNIEIYDEEGTLIKTLPAGKRKGINSVSWQIRKKPPRVPSSVQLLGQAFVGPIYPPGEYTVKINKGEDSYYGKVKIIYDPNSKHSEEDRETRHKTLVKAYDLLEKLTFIDKRINEIKDQAEKKSKAIDNENLKEKLISLSEEMNKLRKEMLATREGRVTGEKKLREKIGRIYGNVMNYLGRPTNSQIDRLANLENEVNNFEKRLQHIIDNQLLEINKELKNSGKSEIKLISWREFMENNP